MKGGVQPITDNRYQRDDSIGITHDEDLLDIADNLENYNSEDDYDDDDDDNITINLSKETCSGISLDGCHGDMSSNTTRSSITTKMTEPKPLKSSFESWIKQPRLIQSAPASQSHRRNNQILQLYFMDKKGKIKEGGQSNLGKSKLTPPQCNCRQSATPVWSDYRIHEPKCNYSDIPMFKVNEVKRRSGIRQRGLIQEQLRTMSADNAVNGDQGRETEKAPRPWTCLPQVRSQKNPVRSPSNRLLNMVSIDDSPVRHQYRRNNIVPQQLVVNNAEDVESNCDESGIYDIQSNDQSSNLTSPRLSTSDPSDDKQFYSEMYEVLCDEKQQPKNIAVDNAFHVLLKPQQPKVRNTESRLFQKMQTTLRLKVLMGENCPSRTTVNQKLHRYQLGKSSHL